MKDTINQKKWIALVRRWPWESHHVGHMPIQNEPSKDYEMSCTIWYHFYNFKNVKYTHEIVLPLGKLHAKVLVKVTLLYGCFSR